MKDTDMDLAMCDISGIDEAGLERLIAAFYARVRADPQLGPVFEHAVDDWPAHLEQLAAFWSSVMLRSGRYKGNPMAVHFRQRAHLSPAMFARWLVLWDETTTATMPFEAATALRAKAVRIADSLQIALAFSTTSQPAKHISA